MSADMASRVAVLENRAEEERTQRKEMRDDIRFIKGKVYEMAASFRILKWVIVTTLLGLGILAPIVLT